MQVRTLTRHMLMHTHALQVVNVTPRYARMKASDGSVIGAHTHTHTHAHAHAAHTHTAHARTHTHTRRS